MIRAASEKQPSGSLMGMEHTNCALGKFLHHWTMTVPTEKQGKVF